LDGILREVYISKLLSYVSGRQIGYAAYLGANSRPIREQVTFSVKELNTYLGPCTERIYHLENIAVDVD
jgi:hypothetical protein